LRFSFFSAHYQTHQGALAESLRSAHNEPFDPEYRIDEGARFRATHQAEISVANGRKRKGIPIRELLLKAERGHADPFFIFF